jgi:hypothetical protein
VEIPSHVAKRTRQHDPDSQSVRAAGGRPTSRSAARRTRPSRRTQEKSFFERYSSLLVVGLGVVGLVIIAFFMFQAGARAAYECDTLLTPGPVETVTPRPTPLDTPTPEVTPEPGVTPDPGATPTPEPTPVAEPTPRLGFTTTILGAQHVPHPSTIRYGFCPPTSGDHFSAPAGPIRAGFYPPVQEQHPGGWVHNLEHGYVVALYRCEDGDCPTQAELNLLQRFVDEAPPSSFAPQCGTQVLAARFDAMETRFALVAWARALLMDEFDLDTALTFAEQWIDHEAVPERGVC